MNGYRVKPGAGDQVLHRDEVANCQYSEYE